MIHMKLPENIRRLLPTKRKLMQLYFALLFNANLKGFLSGNIYQGSSKQVCVPGINCYSCPGAIGACPLGSLQGSFSADKSTLFYVGGILLLYCILFGRMICGWVCPFGLVQELLYKIKTPKAKKSPITRILSFLKYVILAVFVFIVPIIYAFKDTPLPAFCKYICPAGTMEGGLLLLANEVNACYFSMLGPIFTWKFLLMISITVGCVFVFRLFCRFLCPLGALYGLFNRISIFGVKVAENKCVHCNLCVTQCKLDIHHVGDRECISCGECIPVCPTKAIHFSGPRIWLHPNEITENAPEKAKRSAQKGRFFTRCISAVIMLGVLVGAFVHYWNDTSNDPITPPASDAQQGNQVGDLCYGYDLQIVDENGIAQETVDPTQTGKITIINFWGTWCTPCVNELPYFDQIAEEYADQVTVIAVHTHLVIDTAPAYIGSYYSDSSMLFVKDYPLDETGLNGGYYTSLGGRGTFPYTVILDETGRIISIFVSSLEYEDLKQVVEAQLNS